MNKYIDQFWNLLIYRCAITHSYVKNTILFYW